MPSYTTPIKPPRSQDQNDSSNQANFRAQFYENYRKGAEEYDKEFMKKYEEDLNTTLIFVRLARSFSAHALRRDTGWSVLRRNLRFHYSSPVPTPARPEPTDGCSPPRPHLHHKQYRSRR